MTPNGYRIYPAKIYPAKISLKPLEPLERALIIFAVVIMTTARDTFGHAHQGKLPAHYLVTIGSVSPYISIIYTSGIPITSHYDRSHPSSLGMLFEVFCRR